MWMNTQHVKYLISDIKGWAVICVDIFTKYVYIHVCYQCLTRSIV